MLRCWIRILILIVFVSTMMGLASDARDKCTDPVSGGWEEKSESGEKKNDNEHILSREYADGIVDTIEGGDHSAFIRKYINDHYLTPNKIAKTRYMEIGVGSGVTVNDWGIQFDEMLLIEPNEEFRNYVRDLVTSDGKFSPDRIKFSPTVVENFQTTAQTRADFIVAQHVFYHIAIDDYERVLRQLCGNLNEKGMLLITMEDDEGPFHDVYSTVTKHFSAEREWNLTSSIIEVVGNMGKEIGVEVVREQYMFRGTKDFVVNQNVFYMKGDMKSQGIVVDEQVARTELEKHCQDTGEVDPESGEKIVQILKVFAHILVSKL